MIQILETPESSIERSFEEAKLIETVLLLRLL